MQTEYKTVLYHSSEWANAVEQGWVTMSVENGIARMIRTWQYGLIRK